MSTKEEIINAAKNRFAKKEVFIDKDKKVSVTLRELSRPVRDELNKRLFICDDKGNPITHKNDKPNPDGTDWKYKDGALPMDEWISACIDPEFTVKELSGPEWPSSLKLELFKAAQEVNGITVKEAAGN